MTTIVGDWRNRVLVSDTQACCGGLKYFESKVFKVPGGWLGGAGNAADAQKVLLYIRGGSPKPEPTDDANQFLWITDKGLLAAGGDLNWWPVSTFQAIGSGSMAAEALMRAGKTAVDAVKGAMDVDLYSGGKVKVYRLGNKR